MGEIRSTLDLVMEKTRNLTLSKEEKEKQDNEELRKKLNGLLEQFQDNMLRKGELKKKLESLEDTYEIKDKNIMLEEILKRIDFDKENQPFFDLLDYLYRINIQKIQSVLNGYQHMLRSTAMQRIKEIKKNLAETRFISGSAVVPRLETDSIWEKEFKALKKEFEKLLSREKAELIQV